MDGPKSLFGSSQLMPANSELNTPILLPQMLELSINPEDSLVVSRLVLSTVERSSSRNNYRYPPQSNYSLVQSLALVLRLLLQDGRLLLPLSFGSALPIESIASL